jgi:nucleotide-binding universal stress UspA family protein
LAVYGRLFAVELSKHSQVAARSSAYLSLSLGAHPKIPKAHTYSSGDQQEPDDYVPEEVARTFDPSLKTANDSGYRVVEGYARDPALAILDPAEHCKADHMVTGSSGTSAARPIMGGVAVASDMAQNLACPVMIVR